MEAADDQTLHELRSELYSGPLGLEASPPLRAAIARREDNDLFLLNSSHVALDGVGTVRVAQSIGRAYRGVEDPPDPVSLEEARDLNGILSPAGFEERLARALDNASRALAAIDGPTRIAVAGGSDRDGFGFVHQRLSPEETARIVSERPDGVTFNDVLLAALQLTIDHWNADHGESSSRISLMVPVNGRPRDWYWDIAGMYVLLASVSTTRNERTDLATAARAVARQTKELKRDSRAAGLFDLLRFSDVVPLGVKRIMPVLLPLTGNRFIDTAVLSNLGRIPDPPRFEQEAEGPRELWFSPPCRMPLGVGIGAATVRDSLHLVVRYRFAQFDRAAATEFSDHFVGQLAGYD